MTTKEKLTRLIIELIHGLPWEEAIRKEQCFGSIVKCKIDKIGDKTGYSGEYVYIERTPLDQTFESFRCQSRTSKQKTTVAFSKAGLKDLDFLGLPITIGRVMAAIDKVCNLFLPEDDSWERVQLHPQIASVIYCWKLLNDDGSECTLDSQSKETIKALYDLLKEE